MDTVVLPNKFLAVWVGRLPFPVERSSLVCHLHLLVE